MVAPSTSTILCVNLDKGSVHDFKIYKNSKIHVPDSLEVCVDLGYQGIDKIIKNASIPDKKPKNGTLSQEQKNTNTEKKGAPSS